MSNDILVFIEQRDGAIQQVAYELVGEARRLAKENGGKVIGLLIGYNVSDKGEGLIARGLDEVAIADNEELALYNTEMYTSILSDYIRKKDPSIVLIGASSIGRDLAPRCSARVKTGLTADCTSLEIDEVEGNLLMTRPAFGGNILATIVCKDHRPQMATVRQGVMKVAELDESREGTVEILSIEESTLQDEVKVLEAVKLVKNQVNINNAKILVSGGRGVGSKENFEILKELAEKLGGEVAASRAAVDEGWIEKAHQVGQTGTTVRPELYIACGISGAIQHIAGMEQSGKIIAINKDPDAPIFGYADIGIVGDYKKIIPIIEKELSI